MPEFKNINGSIRRYNGCTDPCDVYDGPCACGAWHKPDEPSGYNGLNMDRFLLLTRMMDSACAWYND